MGASMSEMRAGWAGLVGALLGRGLRAEDFVRQIPGDGPVLEIGPFVSPRLKGDHVRYFDVLDQAGLNARAALKGLPQTAPPIDYVSKAGDLSVMEGPMTAVFSAHCIEHQPDLVGHLQAVGRLLAPGGCYFLIAPDKRYCMDHFLPESTVAAVIDAHLSAATRHSPRSIIEHRSLTTHNSARRHWRGDHGRPGPDPEQLRAALAEARSDRASDVHAWTFTPSSFERLIEDLGAAGLAALQIRKVFPTAFGRGEFCAILQRPD
jgi:SAM-dependent methyltransferase